MKFPVSERFPLLDAVDSPAALQRYTPAQVVKLSAEIRQFLIESVAATGGHLGPNLGVVELTLALHRVFNSPVDSIIWDTGHQAYVHKILTGRHDFESLRQRGGLSGYPSRSESPHDVVENSHASTSLSWAYGVAHEKALEGAPGHVVAVIGDGALTGGMAWEAMNNIADLPDAPITIVVNDNGRSYEPTVGGLAHHLSTLRTSDAYEKTLAWGKRTLLNLGEPGRAAYEALHGLKTGLKDVLVSQAMFEDLGFKYMGPVNGHDEPAIEYALERARTFPEPVIVHVITEKGRGYSPAEDNERDHFHAVGKIHPETGLPVAPERFGWTASFAEAALERARQDPRLVAITAAMKEPVGLRPMSLEFPDRVIDVGIAEQHAVTMAAGMAYAGAKPLFALYATFLNRAFDQLLMDVSLHNAPVTFALDRAGITGNDGPSHHGVWDLALASMVPGLRVAAPRDGARLRLQLGEALDWEDGPTLVRYPKGSPPADIEAVESTDTYDFLLKEAGARTLLISVGPLAKPALEAARAVGGTDVVDPGWVLPIDEALVELAGGYERVVVAEDGVVTGGVGAQIARLVPNVRVDVVGVPRAFIPQGSREEIMRELGLDSEGLKKELLRS